MIFGHDESIPQDVFEKILTLAQQGNACVVQKKFTEGIDHYQNALKLIPPPVEQWAAADWLYVAIGECYFFISDYLNADTYFQKICAHEDITKINPLVHLRRAQCLYKLNRLSSAQEQLKLSLVPYDLGHLDDTFYWDLVGSVTIRDDSLPFNCLGR